MVVNTKGKLLFHANSEVTGESGKYYPTLLD